MNDTIFTSNAERKKLYPIKAKILCEGINVDPFVKKLFRDQNPSNVKRGGLSSGGKFEIIARGQTVFVNAPFYTKRLVDMKLVYSKENSLWNIQILYKGRLICSARALVPPVWYKEKVGSFPITQIINAHNLQLAAAVFEDCTLFSRGDACKFCVINRSLSEKDPRLVVKSGSTILEALKRIPVDEYGGLTLNGGMTPAPGRGLELIEPVVREVSKVFPNLPIAVEITPPEDLDWIDRLADAGVSSLMMNLECWDTGIREKTIPGKNSLCPRDSYLRAFERGLEKIGEGRITSCFVVGTEPLKSLRLGISYLTAMGVIPSPLAGRYFEDVPDYPFAPCVDWIEFFEICRYAKKCLEINGIRSTDKAGCVACGMCDMVLR